MTPTAPTHEEGRQSMSYTEFLARKQRAATPTGPDIAPSAVHPSLHDWQAEIVRWAVRTGRAAVWADTGLGKTRIMIEWGRLSGGTTLIVAPLAVCQQTVREASRIGVTARYVRDGIPGPGVWVTNYENVHKFDPATIDAVVLDEASILKNADGKTRRLLIEHFTSVPRRLACTATPAPNDPEELTSQAEFLGRSTRVNMLAAYFVHDNQGWRPKGHARTPMFRWMASWAVALRRPSDLGYPDGEYQLPGLEIVPELIRVDVDADGQLFATELGGVSGRARIRRSTLSARVDRTVQLVHGGPQRVQPELLPGEQGEVDPRRGSQGAAERTEAEAVCRGRGASGEDAGADQRVQEETAPAANGHDVRADRGCTGADARRRLPDLPRTDGGQSGAETSRGPQPRNGSGAGHPVPAVQPGTGATRRGPSEDHGDVPLHHEGREQWLVWCGLNDEQDALVKALGSECRGIDGRTPIEERVAINEAWCRGEFRILVVKPGMYSFGMNWQHCARMVFVGLSDSYESYYQAIRRCYRYGQRRVVRAHIVLSELESQIAANVSRKERDAGAVTAELVDAMRVASTLTPIEAAR